MGMTAKPQTGLSGALFSRVQERVLGLLFGQPDRSFLVAEVIRLLDSGSGAVQRELGRLAVSGLVTVTRVGNQKHYRANRDSPVFAELQSLVRKTVGLAEPLRQVLLPLAARIHAAFVYGSVAKGAETARSDVDLMVIADGLSYADLFEALQGVEAILGRPVDLKVNTPEEWKRKLTEEHSFTARTAAGSKLFLIGSERDLN